MTAKPRLRVTSKGWFYVTGVRLSSSPILSELVVGPYDSPMAAYQTFLPSDPALRVYQWRPECPATT